MMKTKQQKQRSALARRTVNRQHYLDRSRFGPPLIGGEEFAARKIAICETDIANLNRKLGIQT
jgi:hypothetical protein